MRTSVRRRASRSGGTAGDARRSGGTAVGQGLAAVLAVAGLLVTAMPAAHAATAAPAAATDVTPGTDTDTPALVTGLHEEAAATGSAADAARGHLKAKKSRYHVADPARDLATAGTESGGGREAVRLQQKYHGISVLGGEYIVRMQKKDGKRTVTGTSGKYFTELKLDTVEAKVSEETAIARAVGAVRSQLGQGAPLQRPAEERSPARPSSVAAGKV